MAAQEYYGGKNYQQQVPYNPSQYLTPSQHGPPPPYSSQPPSIHPSQSPYISAPPSPYPRPVNPHYPQQQPLRPTQQPPYPPLQPPYPPLQPPYPTSQPQQYPYTQAELGARPPLVYGHQSQYFNLRPPMPEPPYRSLSEGRVPQSWEAERRNGRHHKKKHHGRRDSSSSSSSCSRSHSHARRSSRNHDYQRNRDHHKKSSHQGRDTFLGATGGAIIGDAIMPGLGTLGGLLLGGWGGNKHARQKAGKEFDPHKP